MSNPLPVEAANAASMAAALPWSMVHAARDEARRSGRHVLDLLAERSGLSGRALVQALARRLGLRAVETEDMVGCEPDFRRVPLAKAMERQVVVLQRAGQAHAVVITDPFDPDMACWLEAQTQGLMVESWLSLSSDLHAFLSRLEAGVRASDAVTAQLGEVASEARAGTSLSLTSVHERASPAVKLVNSTLYDALKAGASDIHVESTPTGLAVKFRIDGVLDHAFNVTGVDTAEQVISRLKVLAELDIAERRVPQDGSFMVESGGRDIDLRVSIMPSIHGEDAVIRVLDKRAMIEAYGALTLEALGFDAASLRTLRRLAEEPYGMLLVTGPTGSGKTTTLYGALTEIHDGRSKIITIEDPVEYQLPGILQIPVNERKGLTFAKGLRSILRHDPDKIMVGEIRDNETAEIAVQSALTGHLVLTTVHANNVFDVLGRFTHMGIDPYAFVSALNGIWAQRLVRVNCPHCARAICPGDEDLQAAGLASADLPAYRFMAGAGCGDCRGTGYKGRRAIAEILILTDELREMIVDKAPIRQIKDHARRSGTRTLREAALALVARGETTLAEVRRVTQHA